MLVPIRMRSVTAAAAAKVVRASGPAPPEVSHAASMPLASRSWMRATTVGTSPPMAATPILFCAM